MQKPLLVIRNITREGPGILGELLQQHAIDFIEVDLNKDEALPATAQNFGAVVVLGGPDSANDNTPKMQSERKFVAKVLENNIPYLGICLGMQIMVKVCGGTVIRSPYKEVGFRDQDLHPFEVIMLTHEGEHDPLFAGMGENFRVFQLHGETVSLTSDIRQLAIGRLVKNQVLKVGENAYGIQCHFELTDTLFETWIHEDPDLLKLDRKMLRAEFAAIRQTYYDTGRQLFTNFLQIARLLDAKVNVK